MLFSFFVVVVVLKDLLLAQASQVAASVIGKLVPRIIEMSILKLVGSDISLHCFRIKITVKEKAFIAKNMFAYYSALAKISAPRNPFSSIVTHPFCVN